MYEILYCWNFICSYVNKIWVLVCFIFIYYLWHNWRVLSLYLWSFHTVQYVSFQQCIPFTIPGESRRLISVKFTTDPSRSFVIWSQLKKSILLTHPTHLIIHSDSTRVHLHTLHIISTGVSGEKNMTVVSSRLELLS